MDAVDRFVSTGAASSPRPSGERARVRGAKSSVLGVVRARKLRRDEPDAEHKLWNALRDRRFHDLKFVRQVPIGGYIADFVCRERMLIVEADGGQHAERSGDAVRTAFLNRRGYAVLRFWNNDILQNLQGCLTALDAVLRDNPSAGLRYAPATLSHLAGEGKSVATPSSFPSPVSWREWSAGPAEGLQTPEPTE